MLLSVNVCSAKDTPAAAIGPATPDKKSAPMSAISPPVA